ncbi:MAG: ArsA family ATPase [Alkalispirochaetaceae bacterium]
MKTLFFTGKGGVGKSTLSAATSWQLAEKGYKVLTVSFDPAHNLGDIYGVTLSHKKKKFTRNLYLQEANLEEAASDYVKQNTDILTEVYSYTRAFNLDLYFKVLKHAPGVEEYAALTAMEQLLREERGFDYIVFDTPPTGLTLRILALPRITITWVDRLTRIRKDILAKRHTVHNVTGKYVEQGIRLAYREEDDSVMKKLRELFKRYVTLSKTLESQESAIAVVLNPDYLSLRESQRILLGLQDLELPLKAVYNNKYEPELEEVADSMEKELLKGRQGIYLDRVPKVPPASKESYKLAHDLTVPFM